MKQAIGSEDGHLENNVHNIKFYWAQQGTQRGNWKQYKQIIKLAGQNWLGTGIYMCVCVRVCTGVYVCTCSRWVSYSFNLESWILDYLVHIAVNDRALKERRERGINGWLTFPQAEGNYSRFLLVSWCLAALLCSSLEVQKAGWTDFFSFLLWALNRHRVVFCLFFLVTPMQSKSCVTQVGSTVVCSSYNIFLPLAQAGTVATGAPAVSPTVPLHSSFPHKKGKRIKNNKKGLFQLKYWFLFALSLSLPPSFSKSASQAVRLGTKT